MSYVFRIPKGGLTLPPKDFDMLAFWRKISEDNSFHEREMMVSGLIRDHAYLLMHKFMAHNIFRKQDSSNVSKDEFLCYGACILTLRFLVLILLFILFGEFYKQRRCLSLWDISLRP